MRNPFPDLVIIHPLNRYCKKWRSSKRRADSQNGKKGIDNHTLHIPYLPGYQRCITYSIFLILDLAYQQISVVIAFAPYCRMAVKEV